jgi:hypothetical protein
MPNFVRDQQRTRHCIRLLVTADSSSLVVVQRTRAFQRRIALWKPDDLKIAVGRGCQNKAERIPGVVPFQDQLIVERGGFGTDGLEGVHGSELQQQSLLIFTQARASDRLFKRLLTAGRGLAFGFEELPV